MNKKWNLLSKIKIIAPIKLLICGRLCCIAYTEDVKQNKCSNIFQQNWAQFTEHLVFQMKKKNDVSISLFFFLIVVNISVSLLCISHKKRDRKSCQTLESKFSRPHLPKTSESCQVLCLLKNKTVIIQLPEECWFSSDMPIRQAEQKLDRSGNDRGATSSSTHPGFQQPAFLLHSY